MPPQTSYRPIPPALLDAYEHRSARISQALIEDEITCFTAYRLALKLQREFLEGVTTLNALYG